MSVRSFTFLLADTMKERKMKEVREREDDGSPDKAKWLPTLGPLRLASPRLSGFPVLELDISTCKFGFRARKRSSD